MTKTAAQRSRWTFCEAINDNGIVDIYATKTLFPFQDDNELHSKKAVIGQSFSAMAYNAEQASILYSIPGSPVLKGGELHIMNSTLLRIENQEF